MKTKWLGFCLLLLTNILIISNLQILSTQAQSKQSPSERARAAKKLAKQSKAKQNATEFFTEAELEGLDLAKERSKHFSRQRIFPFKYLPSDQRLSAIRQVRENNIKALASSNLVEPLKAIGPAPISNGRTLAPAGSGTVNGQRQNVTGRVTALAIDPKNTNIIYLGGAQGGVWRTSNGGQSWTPLTDDAPTQAIGSLAIDPTNSNIIYAGTGEGNFSADSFFGMGILKSTDGGQTWQNLAVDDFVGRAVNKVVIDPSNTNVIYAGIASAFAGISGGVNPTLAINGVYKSTNGGQSFTPSLRITTAAASGSTVFDVAMDPNNPAVLYATINGQGIFKTTDSGANWTRLTGGLPSTGFGRPDIGIAASNPSILYASFSDSRSDDLLNIFRSTDGGNSWSSVTKPFANAFGNICQCSYDNFIEVDPTNPNIVYFGGVSLYRSDNGGQSWVEIGVNVHVDHHAIALTPGNPRRIVVGNDGGVWISEDRGDTMLNINNNLSLTQFQSVSIHPTNANITIGGTQDNGTNLYNGTNTWVHVLDSDGGFSRIDQMNPNTMYSTFFNLPGVLIGPLRSDSAGAFNTWVNARSGINQNDDVLFYAPLELDPSKANTLYFGTFRLYRTVNKGVSWTPISQRLARNTPNVISNIGVSKVNGAIYTGSTDGAVFISKDNGASFQNVTDNLPNRYISEVLPDPKDANTVYVSISGFRTGHVFKSTQGGGSWQDISGNLPDIPANALAINPTDSNNIFVGTDLGLFETMDGGKNWQLVPGMPMVTVFDMDLSARFGILRVATHGRGMYETKINIAQSGNVVINNAVFAKPNLTITGSGFGTSGVKVVVNGQDISSKITQLSDSLITLKGNKKKLNLVKGANQLVVTNSGGAAANFTFNF